MPLGSTGPRATATGPLIEPRAFPGRSTAQLNAQSDTWQHFTIAPAELAGGAIKRLETATTTRIVVLELDGIPLFLRFAQDVQSIAGGYDLKHPGGGELDHSTPPFTVVTIMAAANPATPVEVWCLDGVYASRPT